MLNWFNRFLNIMIGPFYMYFFLVAIPFLMVICWVEHKDLEDKNKYKNDLLDRLPNKEIYINLTGDEKYILEVLAKREKLTIDKYIREEIKKASEGFENEF